MSDTFSLQFPKLCTSVFVHLLCCICVSVFMYLCRVQVQRVRQLVRGGSRTFLSGLPSQPVNSRLESHHQMYFYIHIYKSKFIKIQPPVLSKSYNNNQSTPFSAMYSSLNVSQAQEANEHQIQIQQVSPLSEDYHRCKTGFLRTKVEVSPKCFSPNCQKKRRLQVHNCIGRVSLATRLFTTSLDLTSL